MWKKYFFLAFIVIAFGGCDGLNFTFETPFGTPIPQTGLPVLSIYTRDGVGINSRDDWTDAEAYLISNPAVSLDEVRLADLEVRGRGNSSWWLYPKKPYALKFDREQSFFGSYAEKRWVLLANYRDKTLLRNELAFEISRRTDLRWTPISVFVEVLLNGTYMGNYQLTDQVEISENRVNVDEENGYLVEIDAWYDETWKFRSDVYNLPVNIRQPEDEHMTQEKADGLRAHINTLEKVLSSGTPPGDFEKYVDLNSFIDWYLVNEIVGNVEARYPKSVFLSKAAGSDSRLVMGPVWDFDWWSWIEPVGFFIKNGFWYDKFFQDAEFVDRLKARWNALKPKLLGNPDFTSIHEVIAEKGRYLEASQKLNTTRWNLEDRDPIGPNYGSYAEYLRALQNYFAQRINWLDTAINNL